MAQRDIAEVIGANLRRLRDERGLSQSQLAAAVRSQGLRNWSPGVIGLIETGGQRADRVLDLITLCLALGATMDEFLEPTDGTSAVQMSGREPVDLHRIQQWMIGILPVVDEAGIYPEGEDPYALMRTARLVGLDDLGQFRLAVRAVFGRNSFFEIRDEAAGVNIRPGTARQLQARRAAASRSLLAQLRSRLERDGIEALMDVARRDLAAADITGDVDDDATNE